MRILSILASAILAAFLCACSTNETRTIGLELRYASDVIPETCLETRAIAEKHFREKAAAYLLEPAETTVVKSDAQRLKSGPAKLAPVGSYPVVLDEWTLTNRMASVFIHCEKREVYMQTRGGLIDQQHWYGPFKF